MKELSSEALDQIASYFRGLSDPTRLRILSLLRNGERKVGDLAEQCEFTAANVSRHLAVLYKHGLVAKEGRGTSVYYRIADESVYALCDLVCSSLVRQFEHAAGQREALLRGAMGGAGRD